MRKVDNELAKVAAPSVALADEAKRKEQQLTRLPCRGCLASCSYYPSCDGKLWSMIL